VLLVVENNDYQAQQVIAAQAAADRLSVQLQIIHTEHDSIMQSRQVLDLIQVPPDQRPNAIFFEPVGTALAQPARAAAAAGVGWVVLNRENVEYLTGRSDKFRGNRLRACCRRAALSCISKVRPTTMPRSAVLKACS
jgi:hypothetical protein